MQLINNWLKAVYYDGEREREEQKSIPIEDPLRI